MNMFIEFKLYCYPVGLQFACMPKCMQIKFGMYVADIVHVCLQTLVHMSILCAKMLFKSLNFCSHACKMKHMSCQAHMLHVCSVEFKLSCTYGLLILAIANYQYRNY